MNCTIDLSSFGIIEGYSKRVLEETFPFITFNQRKCYDEYYIPKTEYKVELHLVDLMTLSNDFKVEILQDIVYINPSRR
jgi:hypothetical protein